MTHRRLDPGGELHSQNSEKQRSWTSPSANPTPLLILILILITLVAAAACGGAPEDPNDPSRLIPDSSREEGTQLITSDGAGTTVFLGEDPVCSGCALEVEPLGSFGRMEDAILLRALPIVERDGLGRFIATAPFPTEQEVILYDPDGTVVRRIGSTGRGPGEFGSVLDLRVARGDTLLIAHDFRLSAFDSAGRAVRTITLQPPPSLPSPRRIAAREEGGFLMVEIRRGDTLFHPLHRYDQAGQYEGPVGAPHLFADAYRDAGVGSWESLRQSARDPDGNLWALGAGYRLERSDVPGRPDRVIGVKGPAAWNLNLVMTPEDYVARRAQAEAAHRGDPPPVPERGGEVPPEQGPTVPPNPMVSQFTVLDRELLVIAIHLPAENWHEARSILATHELYDTVLDLLDVATGAVLARTRIPGWGRFTSDGTLYTPRESPVGLISFDAWEITAHLDTAEVGRIRSELVSVASDAGASR